MRNSQTRAIIEQFSHMDALAYLERAIIEAVNEISKETRIC